MTNPPTRPRLTHPMIRDSRDEPLRQASWARALDHATRGLERNRGAYGMLSSTRLTNEALYLAQKFARAVMGTHDIDVPERARHAPSVAGLAAAFGPGSATSSYEEIEHTDVIVVWGSDARSTHPAFFRHVLKGIRGGARLYVVDPRRTATAAWADSWLGLDIGTDIPLAHAIGREIVRTGLGNSRFVERATSGFEDYRALVEPWTLSLAERVTGVPARAVRELAHALARAERVQLCWGPGVTGYRDGTAAVRALVNLSLLTGQVGRYGCGLLPLSGRDNVQGAVDMGVLPHRLPGFRDVLDSRARRTFESAWGVAVEPHYGLAAAEMCAAAEEGTLTALHCVGTDPARSRAEDLKAQAHGGRPVRRPDTLDFLVVQDAFLTRTTELADVVLPATAAWAETDGTATDGERRVRRVRRALTPPGEAREHFVILRDLAAGLGHEWRYDDVEAVWNEVGSLSPDHAGMTYARLTGQAGLQWPCPDTGRPRPAFLHGRLWEKDPAGRGGRAVFGIVQHDPPADPVDERYPIRLGSGRHGGRGPRGIELSPEDAERLDVVPGARVQVSSRRVSVVATVRIDTALRPGLAFMHPRLPDEVDAGRPAVRIEKLPITTIVFG
ncbi:molybdopterin oxidoreductase family protein [Streptomyces sp. NPDC091972]|uniref:molybdopterin oxidoreductase family protein n=1 Tax=Streptomyces sp. NPDC091972 TaxID=3366007 RepID=UPI00380058EC